MRPFAELATVLGRLLPLHRCRVCGRRVGGTVEVVPLEGEPIRRVVKAKPEHGCSVCVDLAPIRLELREPAEGGWPPPLEWVAAVQRQVMEQVFEESVGNRLRRLGGVQ